jgi:hypothetical protein
MKGIAMSLFSKHKNAGCTEDEYIGVIADFIAEEFRFIKSYLSAVSKLYREEQQRYVSTYNFHIDKINELAKNAKLHIRGFEGVRFDEGLPVTPLNIDDFTKDDALFIEQVIEPAIILSESGKVIKAGTVLLAKIPAEEKPPQTEDQPPQTENKPTEKAEATEINDKKEEPKGGQA